MAFRLPRLPSIQPVWSVFQKWWQSVVEAIERQEAAQDATINRIRRLLSHTDPTTVMTAEDDGASATVTILDHTRVYADGTTLEITGGVFAGKTSDTPYAVYYDDVTLADTAPTFEFTTVIRDAQAAVAEGRHFLGVIYTPVAGSGLTQDGGGAYPAGSTVGGET